MNFKEINATRLRLQGELVSHLVRKEFTLLYRDTRLGFIWSVASPLLLLGIYSFVFTRVFALRWPGFSSPEFFALQLFVGMTFHLWLAECLQRAPGIVVSEAMMLKRVLFPVQVLPLVLVFVSLVQVLISCSLILLFTAALGGLPASSIMVPFIVLPFCLLLIGLVSLIAALGVYFRDLKMLMGFVSTALLFLSPIFYPVSLLPEAIQPFIWLNPLSYPIEAVRQLLFEAHWLEPVAYLIYCLSAAAVFLLGTSVFHKLQRGFNDVL